MHCGTRCGHHSGLITCSAGEIIATLDHFYIGNNCNTILTWVMLFSLKKKHPERIAGQTVAVLDHIYPSRASEFTPEFRLGSCYSIFSFMCMFDLRILITPFDIFKLFLHIFIQHRCRYVHFQCWLHFASWPFLSRQFYIKAFSSADAYYLIISIT